MAAILDLKSPTLVIVGHWNAAILNEPGWIARHILGVPEGQQIDLQAIIVGNQVGPGRLAPQKQIWMFEHFGMSCSDQRLEIYSRDIDNLQPLYDVTSAIAEKLPHTPVRAAGVNFQFQLGGDLAATTPLLETSEAFDALGAIRSQERVDSIEMPAEGLLNVEGLDPPTTLLNLSRKTDFASAEIKFNYHVDLPGIATLSLWVGAAPVRHWLQHAGGVLRDVYGFDVFERAYF
ncbi:MAG: hypothetical protein R3D27_09630 [Hyphomicrobiaceae bacterium]